MGRQKIDAPLMLDEFGKTPVRDMLVIKHRIERDSAIAAIPDWAWKILKGGLDRWYERKRLKTAVTRYIKRLSLLQVALSDAFDVIPPDYPDMIGDNPLPKRPRGGAKRPRMSNIRRPK